jgi:hypothetical protein
MIHGQLTTQSENHEFTNRLRIYTATLRRLAGGAGPIEYPAGCTLDTYTALWIAIFLLVPKAHPSPGCQPKGPISVQSKR